MSQRSLWIGAFLCFFSSAGFAQTKDSCEPGWKSAGKGTCYLLSEPYINEIVGGLEIDGVLRVARPHRHIVIEAAIYKAGKLLCTTSDIPSSEIVTGEDIPFKLLCPQLPPGPRATQTPDKINLRFSYQDN